MFGLPTLDVVIALVFVYLLLSLVCSAFSEIIEAYIKKRATYLVKGLQEMFKDQTENGLVKDIFEHPLIYGLFSGNYEPAQLRNRAGRTSLPSYIPARNFALAVLDVVMHPDAGQSAGAPGASGVASAPAAAGTVAAVSIDSLRKAISHMPNDHVKRALRTFVETAGTDVNKVLQDIEAWYNSSMERVGGWYKRYSQVVVLFLGFFIALALNADTIAIVRSLSLDPSLRNTVVAAAQQYLDQIPPAPAAEADKNADKPTSQPAVDPNAGACETAPDSPECRLEKNIAEVKKLGLPIGWNCRDSRVYPGSIGAWAMKLFGLLLTALAVSLGAPFWFDLLNKFLVIRSTIKQKEEGPKAT